MIFDSAAKGSQEKIALVADLPETTGELQTDAYLSAMVESLCREASLNPPPWKESPSTYTCPGPGLLVVKASRLPFSPKPQSPSAVATSLSQ
jgi:hypothetical protein